MAQAPLCSIPSSTKDERFFVGWGRPVLGIIRKSTVNKVGVLCRFKSLPSPLRRVSRDLQWLFWYGEGDTLANGGSPYICKHLLQKGHVYSLFRAASLLFLKNNQPHNSYTKETFWGVIFCSPSIPKKERFWYCLKVAYSCLILCDPVDCSTPNFPVLHHLPVFAQSHVHWVEGAIQKKLLACFYLFSWLSVILYSECN